MTNLIKAQIGSISHGTMRPADLLSAFAFELSLISAEPSALALIEKAGDCLALIESDDYDPDLDPEGDTASLLVDALFIELDECAPWYCYFGASEGDGSDYGFWPCREEIDELPRVSDPSEVEDHLGEDVCFVNDHGNVTVYGADGSTLLELV